MQSGGPKQDHHDHSEFGLYYGIVTQNKDPEKLNRVKVKLPHLDHGDVDETHWAQVATPMEGNKFGWYNLPDIDDCVVVMFVHGDFSQPLVIGGVWSKADASPEPNEDGKNNFRGYRSRSGHRLILDDSSKTKVVLTDKTSTCMVGVGNFEKEGAGPNTCAVFTPPGAGKTGVAISSMQGSMEISCPNGKLSVTAQKNVQINATQTVEIKASSDLKLSGQSAATVTSSAPCNYDGANVNIG